ncbi:MAG: type II toxin-antitoxin system RelE/ParE family toxin [Deltaproteobacteria bacterium]
MAWLVEFDPRAEKELVSLDKQSQREIIRYLRERIVTDNDPRRFGKALRGGLHGLWRYRVGNYRLVCQLRDDAFVVLVIRVGHRKEIYD